MNKKIRTILGTLVVFFPLILLAIYLFWLNWGFSLFVVLGIILSMDIIGWVYWFYNLGTTIVDGKKIKWIGDYKK